MIILDQVFQGILLALVIFIMIASLIVGGLLYGPSFESKFMPVISDFVAVEIDGSRFSNFDPTLTYYSVHYTKNRSCDPETGSSAWYIVDADGIQTRVSLDFVLSTKHPGDNSRPVGKNFAGVWSVDNKNKEFVKQKLVIYYNCIILWRTINSIDIGTTKTQ